MFYFYVFLSAYFFSLQKLSNIWVLEKRWVADYPLDIPGQNRDSETIIYITNLEGK